MSKAPAPAPAAAGATDPNQNTVHEWDRPDDHEPDATGAEFQAEQTGVDPGAPAPVPDEPEPSKEVLAKKIEEKRYKDDKRSSIYKKRDTMTLGERQALEDNDPVQAALLAAQAGAAPRAADPDDEEAAEARAAAELALQQQQQQQQAPAPAPAAAPAPAGVAPNAQKIKITVYGQEQEVDLDSVIQAGTKALQNDRAAERRMTDAATYEARLTQWSKELQGYADRLERTSSERPQAQPGPAGNPPTTDGVGGQVNEELMSQALDALANGDAAESTKLMQKAVAQAVAAATKAARAEAPAPSPAPAATGGVPRLQPAEQAAPWSVEQRNEANRIFNSEFGSFDDTQFSAARDAVTDALNDPANAGQPIGAIVRSVCRTVARTVTPSMRQAPAPAAAPASPPAPAENPALQGRRTLKARLPVATPPGSARSPGQSRGAPQVLNNAEYIRRLQKNSGSNSSR